MRIYLLILFSTSMFLKSQAQTNVDSIRTSNYVSVMPKFPGGDTALATFIKDNLVYPEDAKAQGITGVTYIQFTVGKDGSLSNIQVVQGKSLSPSCDQAAIDVFKKSPLWQPATMNGETRPIKIIKIVKF